MRDGPSLPPAAAALASVLDFLDPTTKSENRWRLDGACIFEPKDMFYPDRGESAQPAKRICAICPVKIRCLEYAIETRQWYGVWGMTSEKERRPLIRQIEAGATVEELVVSLPKHGCGCGECREVGQLDREARGA